VTAMGYDFGHATEWVYSDTKRPVGENRPCSKCGRYRNQDGTDPCWGHLPGVQSACCGHGKERPFIMLDSGECLYGPDAEEYVNWPLKIRADMEKYADRGLTF